MLAKLSMKSKVAIAFFFGVVGALIVDALAFQSLDFFMIFFRAQIIL